MSYLNEHFYLFCKKLDLPEDDEKSALEEIQDLTNKKIATVEEIAATKNKELMSI